MKCQKCKLSIKLHTSLDELSAAALNLLVGSTSSSSSASSAESSHPQKPSYPPDRHSNYEKASRSSKPVYNRSVSSPRHSIYLAPSRSQHNPAIAESFLMVTESQLMPPAQSVLRQPSNQRSLHPSTEPDDGERAFSMQMQKSAKLFEILSARSDIDHPICSECTELLIEGLNARLISAHKERDAFVGFLKKVNNDLPSDADHEASLKALNLLQNDEETALQELIALEAEKSKIENDISGLEAETVALDVAEEGFWRDRNAFQLQLDTFQKDRDSTNLQYDHDSKQLEKLQRTNVYNDTFCIGHDGYFGTINNLRLGRLATQTVIFNSAKGRQRGAPDTVQVEWNEINAAWGQTCLLLQTIAEKLHFSFSGYRLKPMGSNSRIEKTETVPSSSTPFASIRSPPVAPPPTKTTSLELFSSGDMPLSRMFIHRRFDAAMVAFLECLRQLGEYVEKNDPDMKLPYKIVKDRIGDSCIRLAFNQDEQWTRACKYTLTCVKFLLAHTSNVAYNPSRRSA